MREALRGGSRHMRDMLLARSDAIGEELGQYAQRLNIPLSREGKDALTLKLGHGHHQGVALRMDEYPYASLEELLQRPQAQREPLVVLDSIQDPQNVGAIIRSACFLGAKGIVLPKDRSASITSSAIKVAAGATAYLPIAQVTNLARALDRMKEAGLWIVGLAVEGSQVLYDVDLTCPLALVVGNEHKGIRPLILKTCDMLVNIPAHGALQSLNAAAAGTIALAEIQRQRIRSASPA